MSRIANTIMRVICEAKLDEDERPKLPPPEPLALLPPRKEEAAPIRFSRDEMDDEIPF